MSNHKFVYFLKSNFASKKYPTKTIGKNINKNSKELNNITDSSLRHNPTCVNYKIKLFKSKISFRQDTSTLNIFDNQIQS